MTLLNDASKVYAGDGSAARVYAGEVLVWESGVVTPPPPADPPLWTADFESGDYGDYMVPTADWNWPAPSSAPVMDTAQKYEGSYSCRFAIPSGGNRCEGIVSEPFMNSYSNGDDYWFSWWVRTNGVPNTSDWQVLSQWKNDGEGSPPLEVEGQDGEWRIGGGYGWPGSNDPTPKASFRLLGTHANDVWVHFVFHIVFHEDPAISKVDAWMDGEQVVSDYYPDGGTLYPGLSSYQKFGYYRSSSITGSTGYVWLDDIRIGESAESVGGTG